MPTETDWSRDYVAFMQCDAGDGWLTEATMQVGAWLREKDFDASMDNDADLESGGRHLSIRTSSSGANARDFAITLREPGPVGTWTTRLLAHDEPGRSDWIHLKVANDQGRFVNAPRLVRRLLDVLPLRDGALEFTAEPAVFRLADVDRLIDLLADDRRHALVFVAGTNIEDDLPFGAFRDQVATWTHELAGLAQVVVLDPPATAEFERKVGGRFAAPAWAIRTYKPGVDFADHNSASRHRILGTVRLGTQSDGRIRSLLGEIARQHAADRPPVMAVRTVRRHFERLENRRMVEAISVVPAVEEPDDHGPVDAPRLEVVPDAPTPAPVDPQSQTSTLGLVKKILRLEDITEKSLRAIADKLTRGRSNAEAVERFQLRVDDLQARVESLEDQNRELSSALDDEQMAHQVALLDVDDRDARIRWLESRLREKGDYEVAYLEVPDEFADQRPSSFGELLERISELPGVEFSGDASETERLNAIDTNDAALRTAWDAVLTLVDYAKARDCGDWDGGLDQYIRNPPGGYRTVPPKKWAATETAATMQGWGDQRVFPVPASVSATGRAEMKAHFKLARIGIATPRMYVLDCHPGQPMVCIGYIGTHLTNTQTN